MPNKQLYYFVFTVFFFCLLEKTTSWLVFIPDLYNLLSVHIYNVCDIRASLFILFIIGITIYSYLK